MVATRIRTVGHVPVTQGPVDVVGAFSDVAESLAGNSELDDLLHLILVRICELVRVPRGTVYLREGSGTIFRGRVGHDSEQLTDARVQRMRIGMAADAFTQEILQTKEPVIVRHAANDGRLFQSTVRAWDVRSMMGVPMLLRGEVIGIITLDPKNRPLVFGDADRKTAAAFAKLSAVAFAQARASAELRQTLETVDRQNNVLRRASAADARLTALVLEGRNLAEIASAVGELTGKLCGVYDAHHRPLAVEASRERHGTEIQPRLFDPVVREHPLVADALASLDHEQLAVIGPLPAAGLHHRYLVAPVLSRGERWGSVLLMETASRFGTFDSMVARRAAAIVALEVMAERRAASDDHGGDRNLVVDLLRGSGDPAALRRQAEVRGFALDRPAVACLVATGAGQPAPDVDEVVAAVAAVAPRTSVLAASTMEGVALLLQASDTEAAAARLLQRACTERAADAVPWLVGVSSPCPQAGGYPSAYAHAREVVQCMRQYCPAGRSAVIDEDDLGTGRLLLLEAGRPTIDRCVEESLGPLLGEDDPLELIETLAAFFDEDRSIRRTAELLEVHENTIRYRLARIERLVGRAVRTDAAAQLNAQLALLVLRLRGRLPGRGQLGRDQTS